MRLVFQFQTAACRICHARQYAGLHVLFGRRPVRTGYENSLWPILRICQSHLGSRTLSVFLPVVIAPVILAVVCRESLGVVIKRPFFATRKRYRVKHRVAVRRCSVYKRDCPDFLAGRILDLNLIQSRRVLDTIV